MIKKEVEKLVRESLQPYDDTDDIDIKIERPNNSAHGHFSTNIALTLPDKLGKSPRDIAKEIVDNISRPEEFIKKIEVKGPGFINFFLTDKALRSVISRIREQDKSYGKNNTGSGKKVIVEFVSANPTGPLNVGHGRQAVLGDTIARMLEWNGYDVSREYYYNDAGNQMRILGYSTFIRYRQLLGYDEEMPEDYYQGEYIKDIARDIVEEYGDKLEDERENEIFRKYAEKQVFKDINTTLKDLNIEFDRYYNEKDLYKKGEVEEVLNTLEEKGATYEKDGAIWFKGEEYGVDKDRVLWKSIADEATYRLPDMAYHKTKFERGFDRIIDVFGADHHATYPDVLAGIKALGYDSDKVEVVINQFVTLLKDGEQVKMSTRKANFVTLDDLINEVGKDVVRYFFIMRKAQSHLDFDLDLAKEESEDNPVFYLQYAHARICSLFRKAENKGIDIDNKGDKSLLEEDESLKLMYILDEFCEVVELCSRDLDPQHVTNYLEKLATAFHKFYTKCRVLNDNKDLTLARLELVKATKIVLENGLNLIGVEAPEKM